MIVEVSRDIEKYSNVLKCIESTLRSSGSQISNPWILNGEITKSQNQNLRVENSLKMDLLGTSFLVEVRCNLKITFNSVYCHFIGYGFNAEDCYKSESKRNVVFGPVSLPSVKNGCSLSIEMSIIFCLPCAN